MFGPPATVSIMKNGLVVYFVNWLHFLQYPKANLIKKWLCMLWRRDEKTVRCLRC